jgi:hypothetical protein
MAAQTSPKIPNILRLVGKFKKHIDSSKFDEYLQQANIAKETFNQAIDSVNRQNRQLSHLISNARLLDDLWSSLLDGLNEEADKVKDPTEKETFVAEIQKIRSQFEIFIPKFYLQAKAHQIDFPKTFPQVKWIGPSTAVFTSEKSLGEAITMFCNELIKTDQKDIKFEIILPQATEQEHEQAKSAPLERLHKFAKKVYESAANAGISPKDIELVIDGKKINPNHDDFKDTMKQWISQKHAAVKQKFQHRTSIHDASRDENKDAGHTPSGPSPSSS